MVVKQNGHSTNFNIAKEYIQAWNKLDNLFKEYNPCQIKFKNGICHCVIGINHCCDWGCKYYNDKKGCTIKTLPCKTFLCYPARDACRDDPKLSIFLKQFDKICEYIGDNRLSGPAYMKHTKAIRKLKYWKYRKDHPNNIGIVIIEKLSNFTYEIKRIIFRLLWKFRKKVYFIPKRIH
jgi:hypothetical protein